MKNIWKTDYQPGDVMSFGTQKKASYYLDIKHLILVG
jgi:hypothetical protein